MSLSYDTLITGFFFTILIMFSEYIRTFFPRQLYKLLINNDLSKHFLLIVLIYFTVEIADNENISPLESFYTSLIIYLFYLFFTKSTLFFSLIIITLLMVNFIIIKQKSYFKNKGENHQNLEKTAEILFYITVAISVISSFFYLNKQLREQKNFSFYKFIFSTGKHSE